MFVKFTWVHAEPKSQPEKKHGARGQVEAFSQIPTTGLTHSALAIISWCVVAMLLMTSHTLRHAERQTRFFPLTHIPEIRPQIKLVQTQSIFWSLSEERNVSSRGFVPYICETKCIRYPLAIILFPIHLALVCLKITIHSCPSKSTQEHEPTSHEYWIDSNCISQEEDVGPMLLFFTSRKFLWFDFCVCVWITASN